MIELHICIRAVLHPALVVTRLINLSLRFFLIYGFPCERVIFLCRCSPYVLFKIGVIKVERQTSKNIISLIC